MQGWEGYPPAPSCKQRTIGFRRKRLLYSKIFLALVSFKLKKKEYQKQKNSPKNFYKNTFVPAIFKVATGFNHVLETSMQEIFTQHYQAYLCYISAVVSSLGRLIAQ